MEKQKHLTMQHDVWNDIIFDFMSNFKCRFSVTWFCSEIQHLKPFFNLCVLIGQVGYVVSNETRWPLRTTSRWVEIKDLKASTRVLSGLPMECPPKYFLYGRLGQQLVNTVIERHWGHTISSDKLGKYATKGIPLKNVSVVCMPFKFISVSAFWLLW